MKICKKCEKEFAPSKGLIAYCSLSCRNSKGPRSEEEKRRISDGVKRHLLEYGPATLTEEQRNNLRKKALEYGEIRRQKSNTELLLADFTALTFERLRKRVILEQDKKCNHCENSKWMGKDIIFELDHINGDNKDNTRENLEALCPNCHSMTDTWRGRNKKGNKFKGKKISDLDLLNSLVIHNWNMRQALLSVGLAAKGANYPRCHKLKRYYFNDET